MGEFANLVSQVPGGWWGALAVFALIGPASLLSKWAGGIPGMFGKVFGRWRNRDLNAVDREVELSTRIEEAVERRVALRLKEFGELKDYVEELRRDLDDAKRDRDLAYEFIAFDAAWHRTANIHASEQGWVFPPPPLQSFAEFKMAKGA